MEPERREGAPRREDYRVARILAATIIVVTIPLLMILDAVSLDYVFDSTAMIGLIVTLFGLLGIVGKDMWRRS